MAAPDDLARRRRHRQPRPTSHWHGDTTVPGTVAGCPVCSPHPFDTRQPEGHADA